MSDWSRPITHHFTLITFCRPQEIDHETVPLVFLVGTGLVLGLLGAGFAPIRPPNFFDPVLPALAANDRFEDYIMCTGAVAVSPKALTDGVWLLDYRSGKLLGTVID